MEHLIEASKSGYKKSGYLDTCLKPENHVRIFTDELSGVQKIEFTLEQHASLRKEFDIKGKAGLGDLISKVATPIARVLGLDCIEKSTGQLKSESPCAKRRDTLNNLTTGKRT